MTPPLTDAELAALAEYLGHVPVNTPERAELYGKIPRLFAEVRAARAQSAQPVLVPFVQQDLPPTPPPTLTTTSPFGYVVAWTDARRKPSFHYDRLTASKALLGEIGFGSGKVVDVYERKESLQP